MRDEVAVWLSQALDAPRRSGPDTSPIPEISDDIVDIRMSCQAIADALASMLQGSPSRDLLLDSLDDVHSHLIHVGIHWVELTTTLGDASLSLPPNWGSEEGGS